MVILSNEKSQCNIQNCATFLVLLLHQVPDSLGKCVSTGNALSTLWIVTLDTFLLYTCVQIVYSTDIFLFVLCRIQDMSQASAKSGYLLFVRSTVFTKKV